MTTWWSLMAACMDADVPGGVLIARSQGAAALEALPALRQFVRRGDGYEASTVPLVVVAAPVAPRGLLHSHKELATASAMEEIRPLRRQSRTSSLVVAVRCPARFVRLDQTVTTTREGHVWLRALSDGRLHLQRGREAAAAGTPSCGRSRVHGPKTLKERQ